MLSTDKKNQLDKVTNFLKKTPSFSLLKFEKTTHGALETLRKQLKKSDAKLMVVKNTILQKAINKLASSKDTSYLKEVQKKTKTLRENTAVLGFGQDWSAGMNVFYSFLKADKTVGFKVGCLDKKMYEETDLIRIAQLPGRGELIGKMLGGMQSPTTHFIHALKFNMQKLVYVLNAKAKQTN
ncbi:50S ribosomal protein L10 [Candidatus Roizmanbacteria bacterium RIFOXYB2_FULL_38_10]|uniref:Large ribosomal subunit protein uL10 n=1 Tax=Candidatus Roizmanbacteria bacterium RIFOXYD1_FULL_38_12 TaxID=1802093 RepID=A0A1F7L0S2_9BACT|nr:MAG: 50S ribosomal protein L10 [Candidatus Roizmanbacteria bacterium RIFOXYA2_FULL_38_14]OGK63715.1 MAG: 50S ribosomal protein L10 [Candidatus Roizmanbacteria bacterium RIFOXYA1_FULL_37_12]OGK65561.1 MAG: 50S ribosomal protein L10 [Candidatus Roizmanbacteria bacterium RIFOXYB1_FULL_40_23]OGK68345.1 MAG: 50S ribosomal protein L10 [Candidatus Roizmanbacteria bacterium RIFOXYB2_FULL_38_10]OGK69966.1 MAG: 50S ribosomal protein L10 [Candidatus Roizmanbacteria bacterium RIFOXYC1_FULL_38_14]OGK730